MPSASKTHKGAAKRFRVSAGGRIKAGHSCTNHLKSGKRSKRLRRLRRSKIICGALAEHAARTLTGGG